jgi:4-aminobutyrate aminotransferase / (S)-3-amino-2-methylpropionate transaminase / 5-aminovalerate transaminase
MSTNQDLHRRRGAAVARGVSSALAVYARRARNAELWDVQEQRYVDFASGISVLNVGHRHPRVLDAVQQQLECLTHACFQVTPYEPYVALAERLNALAPGPTPKKSIFFSSGAEAVENALKIARYHTRRSAVIAFSGAFHGRTLAALSLTGKVHPYKSGFGPLLPEVYHVPFPMNLGKDGDAGAAAASGASTASSASATAGDAQAIAAIEQLFRSDVDPARVAALIIEPVLGEGGFHVAPFEFLRSLRALCDRHGIVMIADEIQCGMARTGRLFAIEHAGVEPDLITVAKSLAGGLPLSGVIGKAAIMDAPPPGGLGGTFAGSPLACAAAPAVLDVIAGERLAERAQRLGQLLRDRLEALQRRHRVIGAVRGLGFMLALELVKVDGSGQPDPELTRALVQAAAAHGLVILACGVYGSSIRLLAPLTISEELLQEGLERLEAALRDVTGAGRT